ncbi:SCO family protein [Kordiimonas aestuarii]|uniref:SCO family protein n=1 Tax=Kordiimonas aestuarii TaxID=1005925 RepID=UPI0021D2595B|nr:SCO family protein [Kordiimonas aestuarii]
MKVIRIVAWAAVVAVAVFLLAQRFATSREAGDRLGGDFTLTSNTGEKVSNRDFRGRYMLIYFGYSFCPDVCPLELAKMTLGLNELEKEGYNTTPLQPIFISIDPERDTVSALDDYVQDFHPRLVALTGTLEEIQDVAKKYRVYFKKRKQDGVEGYLMDHQSFIFVMGPDGDYVRLFSAKDKPEDIASAFRPVLEKTR